ncbi:glycosyltransferase family 4 protein [Aquabacter spiritensis]|uniref:Glycosyltransferase involved in cell wall biosynthesis n=1 Tax=Aquabacter spiritensis TaxID=933073 RepID=A0A4R3M560_9HYPH|nr:glycosyltransferase family 4 protein [Aquabacter spiritensis]TCT06567.1 glycosyltransferase involved in cell wall biosynthesis [Aquabacter spiritensis]
MSGEIWQLVDSSGIGGIETHVRVLAGALDAAGWPCRVVLLADHGGNPWMAQLQAAGVPAESLDGRFSTLCHRLRTERPALLHTHGYKAGIMGRLAARLCGIPSVSTFHAGERGPFPVWLYQRLDEATARLGARIAVSAPIARRLPKPVAVIGNFVPVPDTPPPVPAARTVAFVGRFSPEKGPDLFCALAERFAGRLAFAAFGDGPLRPDLEARYGAWVRFHGLVTDPGRIFPQVGLLLMPSRAEGLPLAAIEAMAQGVPVAASAVGALPDLIRDGEDGWLFPPGDLHAAERAVCAWADGTSSQRAAWSHAAWSRVQERFAVATRLPDVLAVYRRTIAMRRESVELPRGGSPDA